MFDTNSLNEKLKNYIDASKSTLVTDLVFDQNTMKFFNIQTGVKAQVPIVQISTDVEFGDASECGFNAGSDTKISDRLLTPSFLKVEKSWCDSKLLNTFANYEVVMASGKATLPFEEKIVDTLLKKINEKKEFTLWQGTKESDKLDGLLTIISDDILSGVIVDGNVIHQEGNVANQVKALWKALPSKMANAPIFMSIKNFKELVVNLCDENNFHYTAKDDNTYELQLPYAQNKVYGIQGLEGRNEFICTPLENLYAGVDAESDSEVFDMWYSKDDGLFKFQTKFCLSVNYADPEIVFVSKIKA